MTHTLCAPASPSLDLSVLRPGLQTLRQLQAELNGCFLEREEVIEAALLALLTGEHLLLVGPPGTAKTQLLTWLARQMTTEQGEALRVFTWLMSKFTAYEDIFGPISMTAWKQDRQVHVIERRLPTAHLAFLDEVFRGNDAILEALLTIMNERQFDNDGERITVPLLSLFGATNEVNLPSSAEGKLGAVWDRFLFRVPVSYVSDERFVALLRLHAQGPQTVLSLPTLVQVQQAIPLVQLPDGIYDLLWQLRRTLAEQHVLVSDRRWLQALRVLQASALFAGRCQVERGDLKSLKSVLWQIREQQPAVTRVLLRLAAPLEQEVLEQRDLAQSVMHAWEQARQRPRDPQDDVKGAMEALGKLRQCAKTLQDLCAQMGSTPSPTCDQVRADVTTMMQTIMDVVLKP